MNDAIAIYTGEQNSRSWLDRYKGKKPHFACVLGFTETGLIPGISAAGATPADRQFTAIADAEFLVNGVQSNPIFFITAAACRGFSGLYFSCGD